MKSMGSVRMRRLIVAIAATVTGVSVALASPAAAHNLGGDAAQYRCKITAITPSVPGLTASVSTTGEQIVVTYSGPDSLIIDGYYHEPYLRITAAGVDQNQNSPSVELNQALFSTPPADAGQSAHTPPNWQHLNVGQVAAWHDHRIHWMGASRPPAAAADPGHDHLIGNWQIPITVAGTPGEINGTLSWLAIKPLNHWIQVAVAAVVLSVAAVGIWDFRKRRKKATANNS